jgi:hypothetical protein
LSPVFPAETIYTFIFTQVPATPLAHLYSP